MPPTGTGTITNGNLIINTTYSGPELVLGPANGSPFATCTNVSLPVPFVILGATPGAFIYTLNFNQPVNNIKLAISGGGTTLQLTALETFTFNTSGGAPTLSTCGPSCGSIINNNVLSLGYVSPNGGGALIQVNATNPYTQIIITGNGGSTGSAFSLCLDTTTPLPSPSPSVTPTKTATPTVTPTISVTPSNTPNVCKTYELYGGSTDTTFIGKDCDGFTFTIQVQAGQTLVKCATEVIIVSGNGTFTSIGSCPLPTPTNTATPTVTPSNSPTPTVTSTVTSTVTPTNSVTPTKTPTPTVTSTKTPTPTITNTATVTPSVTTTNTSTPSVTPTKTATPSITPTKTPTPTVTNTPSPTQYPFSGIGVDVQYEYTIDMLGSFSGGTAPEGATAPHPIFTDANGVPLAQLNGITLGGFNGLNN
jgi:hypothetical protein